MKFSEIIDYLSSGELSQLALGTERSGTISDSKVVDLVSHTNLGLMSLYTRFTLKEGSEVLVLEPGVLVYPLTDPTLLKVEQVLTDAEKEMPLNDSAEMYSCMMPSTRSLRVPSAVAEQAADLPEDLKTAALKVVFRAAHPWLLAEDVIADGPDQTELELPRAYLQALLYFIASRAHNPVGMSNEFHAGNSWFKKYELECQRLGGENLQVDQGASNTKLSRGGWV